MPNKRKCRTCKNYYPVDSGIVVPLGFFCSMDHAVEYRNTKEAKKKVERVKNKAAKDERKHHKQRKDDSQPLSHWLSLTETSVNAYIRERDKNKPCVSCGAVEALRFDAGHYLSKGAHPELRFEPLNLARQCSHCNVHKSGNQAKYREELVRRIGEDKVLWIEGPHKAKHYTREELKEIRTKFNRMKRDLEKLD